MEGNLTLHVSESDKKLLKNGLSDDAILTVEAFATALNQHSNVEKVNIIGFFVGTLKAVFNKEAVQGIIDVWEKKITEDMFGKTI